METGANYSFYNGSAFTQNAAGTFATFVDVASGAIGSIGGGPVHVDGTLQVTTAGTPAIGTKYQLVTGATRTGTFAASQFTGSFYDVTYPNTGVTLTAKAAPLAAPVFTADSPPPTGTVGTAYSYQFAATGNPTPTYAVQTGGLPAGLSLDTVTGKLTGTPTTPGPSTFTIRATNTVNPPADSPTITIVVSGVGPTVTSVTPSSGLVSSNFSFIVTVRGTGFTGARIIRFGSQISYIRNIAPDGTSLTAWVPVQGPGTVDVTVQTTLGTSAITTADHFTYLAPARPVITAVTPSTGSSLLGALVTIHGSGFTGATAVHFGPSLGYLLQISADGTAIYAYGPPELPGTVDVTVTGPGGTSALSTADQVTYSLPFFFPGG